MADRGTGDGGSGPQRKFGDTSVATSPALGEKAAINLFLAIGSSSSPTHKQRLRMEASTMVATYQWFRGLCMSVRAEILGSV